MGPSDKLPRRDRNHEIEEEAWAAFGAKIVECRSFILQASDRKDYGTDCQLEVVADGYVTNVRVQAQLKGTERSLNADGSLSVEVRQSTLNYLLMQPYSFFACYHLPTRSLRICPAENVPRQYEHSGKPWTEQQTLTVSFTEEMTVERLSQLADLARSSAASQREGRDAQVMAQPAELPKVVLNSVPDVHVPDDKVQAGAFLQELYEKNSDHVISAGFDRFAAVLGTESDLLGLAYMSEINLGMGKQSRHRDRIERAIPYFQSRVGQGRYVDASLLYTIANAYSALGDEEKAKSGYQAALDDPLIERMPDLAAQALKNLGTSFERLGVPEMAVEMYQAALQISPDLPEAHNALGNHFVRIGLYEEALHHFDQAVYADRHYGKTTSVSGWRANVLFNLGRGREAFREINALINEEDRHAWIWPWTSRLVASFGRTSVDNARLARSYWERLVKAHPDVSQGRWELLMSNFYLRGQGVDLGKSYVEFRADFDRHIAHVRAEDAALPWDRLGHWAQDEGDWVEAERCFRIAYDLDGGDYGYCLGIALSHLDRFEESLPLFLEQAEKIQPDAMSWFQVGMTYMELGQVESAIAALQRAIEIDCDYAPARFELGGLHWNSGNREKAREVWLGAIKRYPDHELAKQAKALIGGEG